LGIRFRIPVGILGSLLILWGAYGLWMVLKYRKLEWRWMGEFEGHLRRDGYVFGLRGM